MPLERIQAPSGGLNKDASPDYLKATQAQELVNLLPGRDGKVIVRGPIRQGTFTQAFDDLKNPQTFWAFDDTVLMKGDVTTDKYWKVVLSTQTITNVTASLAEFPFGTYGSPNYVHARYGAYVYGPIDDAAGYALGRWNGDVTIAQQTNAPYNFTDLQVYAQRLFVLGGTLPGTTTPTVNSDRVLFWSDANPSADLSLTATWTNDVSGVVEQLQYDGDDTPVALAGCGRFLAILGSRSINILTGSGSSSFAVRNLTKNWGCVSRASVVEVEDGFFFQSERGYCFCDGSTVTIVSSDITDYLNLYAASSYSAAAMNDGWIALANTAGVCWLMHVATRTWTQLIGPAGASPGSVFRSLSYPLLFQEGVLLLADKVTDPTRFGVTERGLDYNGSVDLATSAEWRTRVTRLSGPTSRATVRRVIFDYLLQVMAGEAADADHSFLVSVFDEASGSLMGAVSAPAQRNTAALHRQRLQFDVFAESDALYLTVALTTVDAGTSLYRAELYDAYVEYDPGRNTPGF